MRTASPYFDASSQSITTFGDRALRATSTSIFIFTTLLSADENFADSSLPRLLEFKEIRKEWKAKKKEEEAQRKADDERQRAAEGRSATDNGNEAPYGQMRSHMAPNQMGGPQLPPIGYAPAAGGQNQAQYGTQSPGMDGMAQ